MRYSRTSCKEEPGGAEKHKFANVNEVLFKMRQHANSVTSTRWALCESNDFFAIENNHHRQTCTSEIDFEV